MAKPEFDKFQKEAINIDINAVVSAGAGSGKTSVLAERFTHLVLDKKFKVEEILTLTFTKKATVEMYDRIYKALREKDESSVADFYKANIKTLDSYCSSIAKQGSHFYGISPSFTVDQAAAQESISSMALPFILSHKDNPAIKSLAKTQNLKKISDELFVKPMIEYSHIANPINFRKFLVEQRKKTSSDWETICKNCLSTLQSISTNFHQYNGNKKTIFCTALENNLKKNIPSAPILDEDFFEKNDLSEVISFIEYFNGFSSISLKGGASDEIKAIKNQLKELREPVFSLISILNFVYGGQIMEQLIPLMEEFQTKANNAKRQNSTLTYADVSSLALKILIEHPEIRKNEKRKYKSIMIDEFQDNNEMQKQLLFLLAEKEERMDKSVPSVDELCKDKLFFVGDEKQSIYRFRGADVSVFRGLSKDFKDGNLLLQTNYRSDPPLIAAFNTLFGGTEYPLDAPEKKASIPHIFYSNPQDNIPDYEPVYIDAQISDASKKEILQMDSKEKRKFYETRIHFAFYDKNNEPADLNKHDYLTNDNAQAAWVVKKIKDLIEKENVNPNEIAILFRSYKYQPLYEQMLLQFGVPYNTETVTGFFTSAVVSDVFSFLKICAYPSDLIAYEKILQSAIVNLSVQESNAILAQSSTAFDTDATEILSGKSLERYSHAKSLYEKLMEESKGQSLAKTVNTLWYDYGYRYETFWNQRSTMYATLYDRIFELARLGDLNSQSLADFVDSVKTYEDEKEHLDGMDIPLEQQSGVHLMTIHKSKGLQFGYIFITNTDHGSSKDSNKEVCFYSKNYGLTVNTPPEPTFNKRSNYFWDIVKEENQNLALAELKRLAYVAITRAKKEVYITGTVGGKNNADSILALLTPALDFYKTENNKPFDENEIPPIEKLPITNFVSGKQQIINRMDKHYESVEEIKKDCEQSRYTNPSKLTNSHEDSDLTNQMIPDRFSEIDNFINGTKKSETQFTYADFGTIAHSFMEAAINKCEPKILNKNILGLEGNKTHLKLITDACKKMSDEFLETEIGKEASSSKWHKAEYSFKSSVADKIISGQIDLLYENGDGSYTIVDYKSNHAIEPEIYYNQLACYRQAVSHMRNVPPEKIKCFLYYLRHGKEVDITESCSKVDLEKAVQEINNNE